MLTKSFSKQDLLFLTASIGLSLLIYYSLFGGFFQQDEWLGYARHVLLKGSTPKELALYALTPGLGHYTPLTPLLVYLSFSLFGLNYHAHVLVALMLQACVIFLFYNFSKFFFRKNLAFFSTLLFGLTAASFQGTAWVVANLGTHMSSIFGLLSLIFITKFTTSAKIKFLILSITALFTSLLFKEITVGLFVILPLAILFWGKSFNKKQKFKYSFTILISGVIYIAFRMFLFLSLSRELSSEYTQKSSHFIYNFITVPIKSISQTLIPVDILKELSFKITSFFGPEFTGDYGSPEFEAFAVERTLEAVSIILSLVFVFFAIRFIRSKDHKKIAGFGLIFMLLSSVAVVLAPEKGDIISAIDSRNLYFISIGSALLTTSFLVSSLKKYFFHAFIVVLIFNAYFLNQSLLELNNKGKVRHQILQEVTEEFPALSSKVVFYTESDVSFYGLPKNELGLPFQSGFGQTLLAWYHPTQNFPRQFFQDRFLWDIEEEGYREFGNRGFGYFRDFGLLASTVKEKDIPISGVLAFRYDSQDKILTNNTEEVKGRLVGFLADKRELDPGLFVATPSINTEDAALMFDGKRDTLWNSEVPYATSQIVDIDLGTQRKIAQLRVDSYNNRDQNEVGYEVSTSQDDKDWRTVFYARRYPPGDNGYVDLFFEPQLARFIRIRQVGFHQYATWVIHELYVYEAINQ